MNHQPTITPNALTLHALRLIGGDWRDIGHVIPVRVDRIVAEAWNTFRLHRAERLLAEGKKPPPVNLVGFRLGRARIYEPSDGNHRTVAARKAGLTHIAARLSGEHVCDTARCLIRGREFVRFSGGGRVEWWEDNLGEDLLAELVRLGTRKEER